MIPLRQNLESVRSRIVSACARAGRRPEDVQLVAVTKGVAADVIAQLPALGVTVVGENRVQEAASKIPQLPGLRWHLIGSLQTNKAKKAVELFESIHSLDRIELAEALSKAGKAISVFVEVNVAGEASKRGLKSEDVPSFVDRVRAGHPLLRLLGVMTMAPLSADPEASRPHFRRLAELAKKCGLSCTSMGMSQDFEVAIEEGATHVRVGSAIFKPV